MHAFVGNGKITPERIDRLESINFEWDPQKAQWNQMFEKLQQFKDEIGHCKVPKVRNFIFELLVGMIVSLKKVPHDNYCYNPHIGLL